jgi:hypothetical protein
VAPAFAASADFAIDKPAGRPCPNLAPDLRCGIHDRLRPAGFPGCTVYDCFGAGQRVSRQTFGGVDWRAEPATAGRMFAVFPVVRQLHELLWYLAEALTLAPAAPLYGALAEAYDQTRQAAAGPPDALLALDLAAHRGAVGDLLRRASELTRAGAGRPGPAGAVTGEGRARARPGRDPAGAVSGDGRDRSGRSGAGAGSGVGPGVDRAGADLIGARLRHADLTGATLRGALLIGADLRGARLRLTDLLGADLRAADLAGADLAGSLFLTQPQLDAAHGDAGTRLPPALTRPAHWPG